jgi:subtilisin family serine protease
MAFASLGCTQPQSDGLPVSGTAALAGAPTAESGIRAGVRYATIFYRPRANAPDSRQTLLSEAGAVHQSRLHGTFPAAVTIPLDRLDGLRGLEWMDIVGVDSTPMDFPISLPTTASTTLGASRVQTVPWGLLNIAADSVHSGLGIRGAGVKIAIIDEGVQGSHPDLDVTACYDTFGAGSLCVVDGAHGTRVAGVAAGLNNSIGTLGIAPSADVYSVRACDLAGCPVSAIYDGLLWALANNMHVVNVSIGSCGGSVPPAAQLVLNAMASAGIVVVAGAGNGPSSCGVGRWAAAANTIGVSAYGTDLLYKPGYQYGPEVDFAAPTDVFTTDASGTYGTHGGTSIATPHVTGAVALMREAGFTTLSLIYQRLKETAFQPGTPPRNDQYGWGQLRVGAAIVAKPRADSIIWCTGAAITNPGCCSVTAFTTNGIAPIQVKFEVSRSDQAGVTTYGWGSATRSISVAAGDYTLSIKVVPREQTYLRVGYHTIQEIPVCTTGGESLAPGGCGEEEEQ